MTARSAKPLFQATKPKPKNDPRQTAIALPAMAAPFVTVPTRDPLDFDPTPPEPTRAFLSRELPRLRELGGVVWENAVGDGRMARELATAGLVVRASDIRDRGWPGTVVQPLYDFTAPLAPVVVTNPPYNLISGRDGRGGWLQHCLDIGVTYCALLLNWDWPAARSLAPLLARYPITRQYLCRWKIDFRGGGSPPQRNGWFVWDLTAPCREPVEYLDRNDTWQHRFL